MMRKELSDYIKSQKDFDEFCNLFLKKEVSPFVKVYGAQGRDGGIDANYTGIYKERDGTWVFQYKFFDPTIDKARARRMFLSSVIGGKRKKGELDKANELKCDHYVLMTNTLLTAGNIGKIEDAKDEKRYTFSLTCWDAEDLITMTDEFPYLLNSFRQPHLPVFLPWQDAFRDQIACKYRLLRYDHETFGRENEITQFQTFVQDRDKRLLIVHGSGGIGKTKLAIEFAKTVEQKHTNYEPLFVQMLGESFENSLEDIPPNRKYVFFIDDAHEFMDDFKSLKVVINSEEYSKSKVVLFTRKIFKEPVKREFLSVLPDKTVDELEVLKLSLEKTEAFIQAYTKAPKPVGTRLARLAVLGRDTPLIAVMVIDLFNKGTDLSDLTKDVLVETVFKSYLNDIFNKHLPNSNEQHRELLNWISAVGPIDAENNQICEKLADTLEVKLHKIEQYRSDLLDYGLLVQIGRKQRVFPDVLSDYILQSACFLSDGRPSSFHKTLLEEFLPLPPANLIKNLARIEDIAGETILLNDYVDYLQFHARKSDNAVRMLILTQIEGICYFRPDDAIKIFNIIIDNPNDKVTEVEDTFLGKFTLTHQALVSKIAKEARKTVYTLSGFHKTLEIIGKLLRLKNIDFSFGSRPEWLLKDITRFEIGKSFVFQRKALDTFEAWKHEDIQELSLPLLNALDSLLVLDFKETISRGFTLNISWHALKYTSALIEIRDRAINLIENCLRTSQHNIVKLKAIECISNALRPFHGPGGNNPNRLEETEQTLLQKEQARFFEILANQLSEESDFIVLNAIDECLHVSAENSQVFLKEQATQVLEKFKRQKNYEKYLFYRQFTGKFQKWTMPEEHQKFVERYVSKYRPIYLAELIQECLDSTEKEADFWTAAYHLWVIGSLRPTYGSDLLNHILAWQVDTPNYASGLLGGIRSSNKVKAKKIVHRLLNKDSIFAKHVVVGSYCWISDGQQFDRTDLQILTQLSETPNDNLRSCITKGLPNFYSVDANTALQILVRLSTDESPLVKREAITALIRLSPQEHLDTYKEVMHNCVPLGHLDYRSEIALHTIFLSDPIWVIAFFEKRIAYQEEKSKGNNTNLDDFSESSRYEAIPIRLHYLFKDVDWNDKNTMEALRRVRDWGLGPPGHHKWLAPELLASMAGEDNSQIESTKINKAIQTILKEWIDSEDPAKMWWAACLMRNFDTDKVFYSLVESLLIKSKGEEEIQDEIEASIGTESHIRNLGEPWPHFEKRIEDLKALQDRTESPIVEQFADRLIDKTKQEMERELQRDEEILEGEVW